MFASEIPCSEKIPACQGLNSLRPRSGNFWTIIW
jgi:hypothetical protein